MLLGVLAIFAEPDVRGFGTHEQLGLPACRAVELAGLPCPACGVTTSAVLAARGRVLEALDNQPFGALLALALPLLALLALRAHRSGRDLGRALAGAARPHWLGLLALAVAAGWLWRLGSLAAAA